MSKRCAALGLAIALALGFGGKAVAASAKIVDLLVTKGSDDLLVFATLEGAFTKEIEESITSGVSTTFTYYLRLMRRRALFDQEVTALTISQGVSYDLLKDEFTFVREIGEERFVRPTKSYAEVKRWMGELRGVRLGSLSALEKDEVYYVLVKAEIRSIKLFFPLNYLFFFLSFFNFDTPWARSGFFKVGG